MKRTVTIDDGSSRAPPARRNRVSRFAQRSSAKSKIPRTLGTPNGVHMFRKVATISIPINDIGFQSGATVSSRFAMQFNLNSFDFYISAVTAVSGAVPGVAELSNLFDQVMVDNVVVKMSFMADPASQPTLVVPGAASPLLYHCIDYNDASVPANVAEVNQYGNVKSKILAVTSGPIIRKIKPCFAQIIYVSPIGATSYRASRGYIQNFNNVPHYGMKGALQMPSASAGSNIVGWLTVDVAYTYNCKNTV